MSEYQVIYTGTVKQVYLVDADSEEEAREKWYDTDPVNSEVTDGEVSEVRRID